MAERREGTSIDSPESQYEVIGTVPEYYIDSMHFQTQLYTSIIFLGESPTSSNKKPLLKLKIKVSPQMLKAMALLLSKQLREYESSVGPVSIPKGILHEWGLEDEL